MQQIKSRQLNLFKLLVDESTYKPTSYFSNVLGVSYKTIYNDIDYLNKLMEVFHMQIEKMPRNGLILKGDQKNKDDFLKELMMLGGDISEIYSPTYRRMEIMRLLLLEVNEVTLASLEQQFYVTVASLRCDLEILHQFLKPFQLTLSTTKMVVILQGSEAAKQKAMKHYILDMSKSDDYDAMMNYDPLEHLIEKLFDPMITVMVKDTLNHLIETSKRNISDYYVRSIYITFLILISRIRNDYHMRDEDARIEDISHLEPFMIAVEISESFEKQCGLKFNDEDIRFLSSQLFAHGIEPTLKGADLRHQYVDIVNEMIMKMSEHLETNLQDDEKLFDSLLFHIPPMIYRLKRKIKISNPLLQEIKNQYIVLFSLTWYVASDLEQCYDVHLDDDEISFLFIYFQVSLEKRHGIHFKNIVIVCPIGLATSELIFTRVRQMIPTRDNISTKTVQELYISDLSNVDFVISTVKLKEITPPVIYVSPLVNDDDMDRITQYYSKLNKQINTLQQYPAKSGLQLKDFINDTYIYWQLPYKSKEECLDYLIDQYRRNDLVSDGFGQSLYEREAMGDTSLYTGVAIPHALPDTVKKSTIAIATLPNKIKWGANDVNIIIVIGIAKKDINHIKEVLSKLLSIVESNESIEQLLHTKDKKELLQVLQETI